MKWEIPDEPDGVYEVWGPDETGDGVIHWIKPPMPSTGSRRYWIKADDWEAKTGPGLWHSWGEVLKNGPLTDEDPFPSPPPMMWSPMHQALYIQYKPDRAWSMVMRMQGSRARNVSESGALPADAMPVGLV